MVRMTDPLTRRSLLPWLAVAAGVTLPLLLPASEARNGTPASPAAPTLRLVSADLPPFAVDEASQPRRPGALVELVELLLARFGQPTQVEFFPWSRALHLSLQQPRVLVLPLTRTPEREAQFQWLIKLYAQRFVFMTRIGDPPVLNLDQARGLRVAVLRGSPGMADLMRAGFSSRLVVNANSFEDAMRMLELQHVQTVYGSEAINQQLLRESGRKVVPLHFGMPLNTGEIWLAASGGISEAELRRLRELHLQMLRDGSAEAVFKAYGLSNPPPDRLGG